MTKRRLYNFVEKNIALLAKAPKVTIHNVLPLLPEPKVIACCCISNYHNGILFLESKRQPKQDTLDHIVDCLTTVFDTKAMGIQR